MTQSGFVAGTLVHTDKGLVPIEQIKVGDMVLSKHESGDEHTIMYKAVINTMTINDKAILQLPYCNTLNPAGDLKARFLYLTTDNLIWVVQDEDDNPVNQWTPVQDVAGGSHVLLTQEFRAEVDGTQEQSVLKTNNTNIGYVYDIMNDAPEILVDFSNNKIQTYDLQDAGYNLSDETLPADFDSQIVKDYLDFFETQGYPDVYKTTTYNISVADYHTYYVGTEGIWVHALP